MQQEIRSRPPGHGSLVAKDARHVLRPWADLSALGSQDALIICQARGVEVVDSEGKKYLDAVGRMWCVTVGYGRQELIAAMAAQARKMPYFTSFGDVSNEPATELAALLAELSPGDLNRVHFTTCGSTAVESAVRVAHLTYCEKSGILVRSYENLCIKAYVKLRSQGCRQAGSRHVSGIPLVSGYGGQECPGSLRVIHDCCLL